MKEITCIIVIIALLISNLLWVGLFTKTKYNIEFKSSYVLLYGKWLYFVDLIITEDGHYIPIWSTIVPNACIYKRRKDAENMRKSLIKANILAPGVDITIVKIHNNGTN